MQHKRRIAFRGRSLVDADFNDVNLQGADFSHAILTRANFKGADLRGANFTNAQLQQADFRESLSGLQRHHHRVLWLMSLFCSALAGLGAGLGGSWTGNLLFFNNSLLKFQQAQNAGIYSVVAGLLAISILIILLTSVLYKGLSYAARTGVLIASGLTILVSMGTVLSSGLANGPGEIGVGVAGSAGFVVFYDVSAMLLLAISAIVLESFLAAGVASLVGIVLAIYLDHSSPDELYGHIIGILITCSILVPFSLYVAQQSIERRQGFSVVYEVAKTIAAIGGTSFRRADLSNADFTSAQLKQTDFRAANLNRCRWYAAQGLDWARLGNSILADRSVRELLICGNGNRRSYAHLNLQGANLLGADLCYADFSHADLSGAILKDAQLEWCNFTQTQVIGTDFTRARLTGACGVGTWNLDDSTVLDQADCRWIYLLEHPKPGTDDRERRPSSGEFAPGEFTNLFREVIDTIDLIFRNGIQSRAFMQSLEQVKQAHSTPLELQSLENKGNGVVVVRLSVSPQTDKAVIHEQFMQLYHTAIALSAEETRRLNQHEQEIQSMRSMIEQLITKPQLEQVVVLRIAEGSFEVGFPITLQILRDGSPLPVAQRSGYLPPSLEVCHSYHLWRGSYCESLVSSRLEVPEQVSNIDRSQLLNRCRDRTMVLQSQFSHWLQSESFQAIEREMQIHLSRDEAIRVLFQVDDPILRRLPWQRWRFFRDYRRAEMALSSSEYRTPISTRLADSNTRRMRVLSIFGDSRGIDLSRDRAIVSELDADVNFLIEPQRQTIADQLWDQPWDILFFAGHSRSFAEKTGILGINQTDEICVDVLENALSKAISAGLKLAIFNSCDGLGLANVLSKLHIPQMIVMREPVADAVAHRFLINFLKRYTQGNPLYESVRQAREALQDLENDYPCATWLPILIQNPAVSPSTWQI